MSSTVNLAECFVFIFPILLVLVLLVSFCICFLKFVLNKSFNDTNENNICLLCCYSSMPSYHLEVKIHLLWRFRQGLWDYRAFYSLMMVCVCVQGIPPVSKMLNGSDAWVTVLCKKLAPWWPWVSHCS